MGDKRPEEPLYSVRERDDARAVTLQIHSKYLNYDVSHRKLLMLKAGVYKVPMGRQELTSFTAQQFGDRSIVSTEYEKSRDVGVMAWGQTQGNRIEYRAGCV